MGLIATALHGAWVIEPEFFHDERGFFARVYTRDELAARGLRTDVDQLAYSHNRRRGTLRGMHYQAPPHAQAKLVRCTRGAVQDVIVDLRADSATYKRWVAVELSAENGRALYVPEGLAHGFLTLADDSEVAYHLAGAWQPGGERGVRFDDPAFGIVWPFTPEVVSRRDRGFAPWNEP